MSNLKILSAVLLACVLLAPNYSSAQESKDLLAQLSEEEMESLRSLVLYPGETRMQILEAATQPSALLKMEKIKQRTSDDFNALIGSKDRETQQALWDLTRYPGLIDALVAAGPKKGADLNKVLSGFDSVVHDRAKSMYATEFATLEKISVLDRESEAAFASLLKDYPQTTRNALQGLLEHPEVLSIMSENMDLTVTVGDMYRRDPKGTILLADSLNQVEEAENAQELADWKDRLENDPEAREALEKSAKEFQEEQVPDDVYYTERSQDAGQVDPNSTERIVEHHYYYDYNYPYWYSYPRWYTYPRWRPYPWWYDWGFNYGWGGGWFYFGMPSYYYMNWYFGRPWNHYNYPGLTCAYMSHYYAHRNSLNSISVNAQVWHGRNSAALPNDLSRNNGNREEAVREFGRMESERQTFNQKNPGREIGQSAYVRANADRFNTLAESVEQERPTKAEASRFEAPTNSRTTGTQPTRSDNSTTSPRGTDVGRQTGNPPGNTRPTTAPTQERREAPTHRTSPAPERDGRDQRTVPTQPRTNSPQRTAPNMNRAADHHRSGWSRGSSGRSSGSVGGGSRTSPSAPSSSPSRSSGSGGSSPRKSR